MTRTLTAGMVTEITKTGADYILPALLVKAEFDSGNLSLWTGLGPLTWDSEDYTGVGDLLEFSAFEETQEIRSVGLTIGLSGIPSAILSTILSEKIHDRPLSVWFATLDDSNDPATIISDPAPVFRGFIDGWTWTETGDQARVTGQCESRMRELERARVSRYTAEEQKRRYANDSFFDYQAGLNNREITLVEG